MGIFDIDMLSGLNKIETAIALIQAAEPMQGFYGAFSGGKDSEITKDLTKRAKVKADWHYCVSPFDPPAIYQHIRTNHPDVAWDYYVRGFWNLVVEKGLPTRKNRWCCEYIKEAGGEGRVLIVGNRSEESNTRNKQKCFEKHSRYPKVDKIFVRPIITWTKSEVWEYIDTYKLQVCSLYSKGFERLGCIMCPVANYKKRLFEMEYFPKIAYLWRRTCQFIVDERLSRGNLTKRGKPYKYQHQTGDELFDWWLSSQ